MGKSPPKKNCDEFENIRKVSTGSLFTHSHHVILGIFSCIPQCYYTYEIPLSSLQSPLTNEITFASIKS